MRQPQGEGERVCVYVCVCVEHSTAVFCVLFCVSKKNSPVSPVHSPHCCHVKSLCTGMGSRCFTCCTACLIIL